MVKTSDNSAVQSQLESPSSKRKKPDDHEPNGIKKKARTRVSYSCGECHRRKQKCDRQVPCSHCVARKVPELCKAYTPGKSDQDIHVRLARLEHIIETALPHYAGPSTPGSPSVGHHFGGSGRNRSRSSTPDDDNASQAEEHDVAAGTFQSGNWYGNSASGSIAPVPVLEQLQQVGPSEDMGRGGVQNNKQSFGPESMQPDSSRATASNGLQHTVNLLDSVRIGTEPTAADKLKSLVQDCGVSPHKLSELINELPPRGVSDALVDYYFKSINWTRYPLSESDFRDAYKSVCTNGLGANPSDMRFLPLLFVVLAIAVRLSPEHLGGDAHTRRISSLRYYWSSRRSLLIAAAIQPDSLEMVLVRLLSARFLTFDRRITECWSQLGAAVRTAQALGLHRDGQTMGMEPSQLEYRRRIWAYLYHADRSYALVLGRPNAIQDDYTSTLPPMNIDDPSILNSTTPSIASPLSTPTQMTFVILRHALAAIIGRMVHHFQQVRHRHYSEVLALDDELQRFIDNLPPHFAFQPDISLDAREPYIPVHRFLLITEILFVRISLHRPYLLRKLGSDRYARSRRACFTSAMIDFEVRQAFRKTMPKDVQESMSNAYREFQTAMISGIYLVLDPKGHDADAMHSILDAFLKDHEGLAELDDTTRRELKIIEFLKNKSSLAESIGYSRPAVAEGQTPGSNIDTSMDAQANLLLSLQQSRNSSSSPQRRPALDSASGTRPGTPLRPAYLNLAVRTPPMSNATPNMASPTSIGKPQSPTFQRVQTDSRHSPAATGSPGTEDEPSAAQSLLDHWVNTVNSGPPTDIFGGGALPGQWNAFAGAPADASVWLSSAPFLPSGDPSAMGGLEGSDYSYWENLVNQIRGGPAS
ncbi:hypothetical protein BD410DRAFT_780039 [Rickenella mellea]|uniref:Zn(2)-C6 fungal-type domain-containing protein n=1 Tax=Rickenella mellea TaxID=50990 RepID=A0A4R5XEP9_9AGAM|nr:hypothetical protein BD410DRAFT_780039 [Rickenella mellea]